MLLQSEACRYIEFTGPPRVCGECLKCMLQHAFFDLLLKATMTGRVKVGSHRVSPWFAPEKGIQKMPFIA